MGEKEMHADCWMGISCKVAFWMTKEYWGLIFRWVFQK